MAGVVVVDTDNGAVVAVEGGGDTAGDAVAPSHAPHDVAPFRHGVVVPYDVVDGVEDVVAQQHDVEAAVGVVVVQWPLLSAVAFADVVVAHAQFPVVVAQAVDDCWKQLSTSC